MEQAGRPGAPRSILMVMMARWRALARMARLAPGMPGSRRAILRAQRISQEQFLVAEQGCGATGVEKDDILVRVERAPADVIEHPRRRLAAVHRIKEDTFRPRQQCQRIHHPCGRLAIARPDIAIICENPLPLHRPAMPEVIGRAAGEIKDYPLLLLAGVANRHAEDLDGASQGREPGDEPGLRAVTPGAVNDARDRDPQLACLVEQFDRAGHIDERADGIRPPPAMTYGFAPLALRSSATAAQAAATSLPPGI